MAIKTIKVTRLRGKKSNFEMEFSTWKIIELSCVGNKIDSNDCNKNAQNINVCG